MADELFEVPLFPLNVVLFPGMALPLHIFEPRYRAMTADCLADHAPFGVAMLSDDSESDEETPARVGTLARIVDYEKLPDGCFNLLTVGAKRFEIVEVRHTKPYLTGLVRPLRDTDDPSDPGMRELARNARDALQDYLRVVLALVQSEERKIGHGEDEEHDTPGAERRITIPESPEELSFLIGMCLTCEDCDKQGLLEMTSIAARLRSGAEMLREEVEILERQIENQPAHEAEPRGSDRAMLN